MQATSGFVESEHDGISDKKFLLTYSEEEQQENKINRVNAKAIFSPKFVPFYLGLLDHGLNHMDCLVLGFIDFYASLSDNGKFYFSNGQLAKMFRCSEKTISRSIKALVDHKLIIVSRKVKTGGGQIRLVRLDINVPLDWTRMSRKTGHKCPTNNNSINNNNINNNKLNNLSDRSALGCEGGESLDDENPSWQGGEAVPKPMPEEPMALHPATKPGATHEQIVKIFDVFAAINPGIAKLYGARPQRAAISALVARYGFEMTEYYATIAVKFNNRKYAPIITTPVQLLNKIASLIAFIEREREGRNNIVVG